MGFRVFGIGVQDLGFRVTSRFCRESVLFCHGQGWGTLRVKGLGVLLFPLRVPSRFWVWCWVLGLGLRV